MSLKTSPLLARRRAHLQAGEEGCVLPEAPRPGLPSASRPTFPSMLLLVRRSSPPDPPQSPPQRDTRETEAYELEEEGPLATSGCRQRGFA